MHLLTELATAIDRLIDYRARILQVLHEFVPHLVVELLHFGLVRVVVPLKFEMPVETVSKLLIFNRSIDQILF